MKILIVDDSKETQYLLETLMIREGHSVTTAANGEKAMKLSRKERPGLIISDILMPVMDGFELCRQVKADPALQMVPFVFYTATYTDDRDEELAYKLGADGFIRKPAEPEVFLKSFRDIMKKAEAEKKWNNNHTEVEEEKQVLKLYNERLVKKLERKMLQLEAAYAEQEQDKKKLLLFRTLLDHSNDAIFVIDPGTERILDVDEQACRGLGYTREELLDLRVMDIEAALPDDFSWDNHVQEMKEKGYLLMEGRHLRKDGSTFPVEINVKYVPQDEKNYVVAVVRDVTERKKLEAQFLQAQKMEAIGRFAGGIAHDFNNLLTAIIGYADLLLHTFSPEQYGYDEIKTILESANRAAQLTRQILVISRKQTLEPVVLNLNQIIDSMCKMCARLLGEDVKHRMIFEPDLKMVKSDPGQIEQVLLNLVVNARDAMPDGGSLTLTTGNQFLDASYCDNHPGMRPGEYVFLSVEDTGQGMSEEVKTHIFDPFYTTKKEGTGLGLSTVYGIVKQLGGHVYVYSEPGQGTTFRIYFPAVPETADEKEGPLPSFEEKLPLGNETILIVEDESVILDLAVRVLSDLGYTVLSAGNGEEAVRQMQEHAGDIDLFLTDVILPGQSGPDIAMQIRKTCPAMKILFMSGYADERIPLDLEGVHFLAKPFTPSVLARKVRGALDT